MTALLDRIEAETNQVRTLRARLRYTVVQGLLGDEQVRFGDLWYAAPDAFPEDPPGQTAERLAVHLQREKIDGRFGPADQWLIFDGSFFLERDESARRATRRALRPERDDQPAAALPVPIRLDRAEAQRRFEIVQLLGDARPGDAPEGISLAFTPRPGVDARPVRITFDADSLLPLEVRFGEPDGDLTVFRLIEPELNPDGIPRERFDTALPAGSGWDNQSVPFEG
ncbi:MAG: outer membrane lipoprotein carrier protein LolA [Planctomycetota bacterium]